MGGRGRIWRRVVAMGVAALFIGTVSAFAQYREDGEYYKAPTRKVPERVLAQIVKNAEKRYPDNGQLQQHTIETQQKSYFKVQGYKDSRLPAHELTMIKRNAVRATPHDYVRQLVTIRARCEVYLRDKSAREKAAEKTKTSAPEK
jgi:hypothetical protein